MVLNNPPWWQVHGPVWAGIVALTIIASLLVDVVPAAAMQLLWPMTLLIPAFSSHLRARRQDWTGRWRRGAFVDVVLAVILGGAMLVFQFGRGVEDEVTRFQLNAALLLAVGQPAWAGWALYDSLMLFFAQRRGGR